MKIFTKLINSKEVIELDVKDVRVPAQEESNAVFDSRFNLSPFAGLDFIVKNTDFDYDYDTEDDYGDVPSAYLLAGEGFDADCQSELLPIIETNSELVKGNYYIVYVNVGRFEIPSEMIFYAYDEHRLVSLGRLAIFEECVDLGEDLDNEIDDYINTFKEQLRTVIKENIK